MFKFKHQCFPVSIHEIYRVFSASSATSLVDSLTESQTDHLTNTNSSMVIAETSIPQFSVSLDPKHYISALFNCKNLNQIRQVHAQVAINGMVHDLPVGNKLLYIYVEHKALADAYALFGGMKDRDPVCWSIMVGGFSKVGDYTNCFGTFRELIRSGEHPDNYTLPLVIRACRNKMDLQMGRLIHHIVCKFSWHSDTFVLAALVD
ncbi:hypothetical protein U1Q18_008153, partial [Sarracenia purpurea var. burkii]